ncbi:hypothetical protein GYMLUDRAFT_777442 [Collybiopsis luxurians FD-317 M1]|uniref:Uncharacterized protein n=1 Tax=Collybiopsis luxurians FD-317 M1 TaxID=944289 RepID=A0A0D0CFU4_9AGAR|nr:hypothetical protein GYMLUDRAFT_777442 [Collybiopsis luxurians FD-317 M1]
MRAFVGSYFTSTTSHVFNEQLFGASSKPFPHEITRRTRTAAATDRVLGARRRFEEVSSSILEAQQIDMLPGCESCIVTVSDHRLVHP